MSRAARSQVSRGGQARPRSFRGDRVEHGPGGFLQGSNLAERQQSSSAGSAKVGVEGRRPGRGSAVTVVVEPVSQGFLLPSGVRQQPLARRRPGSWRRPRARPMPSMRDDSAPWPGHWRRPVPLASKVMIARATADSSAAVAGGNLGGDGTARTASSSWSSAADSSGCGPPGRGSSALACSRSADRALKSRCQFPMAGVRTSATALPRSAAACPEPGQVRPQCRPLRRRRGQRHRRQEEAPARRGRPARARPAGRRPARRARQELPRHRRQIPGGLDSPPPLRELTLRGLDREVHVVSWRRNQVRRADDPQRPPHLVLCPGDRAGQVVAKRARRPGPAGHGRRHPSGRVPPATRQVQAHFAPRQCPARRSSL